ncbi:MAG: hypothetical protein PHR11_06440 [Candidatus Omnitrophica bacterium]|nr:hypothetical protein [Candidatus Omnitrophota bacterium]
MAQKYIMQYIGLSIYILFVCFSFCDGFKLHITRKLLWLFVVLLNGVYVLQTYQEYSLTWILPIPTLFAILLCRMEQHEKKAARDNGYPLSRNKLE